MYVSFNVDTDDGSHMSKYNQFSKFCIQHSLNFMYDIMAKTFCIIFYYDKELKMQIEDFANKLKVTRNSCFSTDRNSFGI